MAISTDASIIFFGTQDEVTSGTPATIANNGYGKADQGASVNWTNDDDAPFGAAVIKCQFDTTMPTVGNIGLFAHLLNVQSTNDTQTPAANNLTHFLGSFIIPESVAADTDFYAVLPHFEFPMVETAQRMDFYVNNNATSQTIGVSWQLWITPKTEGPHA